MAGGTYDDSKGWFVQPTIIRCKTPTYVTTYRDISLPEQGTKLMTPAGRPHHWSSFM